MASATRCSAAGSARDEPPYFWTTVASLEPKGFGVLMFKSIFGTFDKPKGAAPLPLGLVDLIVLNAVVQAASIGYLSALFRRDLFSPLQGITTRLAYPVITDLIALAVLGFFALALTTLKSAPDGTRLPLWMSQDRFLRRAHGHYQPNDAT